MLLSELGAALRKARKERHLTLKQVAEQAGVHFTTLSSLERGTISELGVRKLLRVAETLGLELVLRPTGQRFTLDDVAKERAGQGVNKLAKKSMDQKDGLLARALRGPLDGSSNAGAEDRVSIKKNKSTK